MKCNLNCNKMLKFTEWNMHYTVLQSRLNIVNCLKYLTSYSLPLATQHQIGHFLCNRDTFMHLQPNKHFWRLYCIINHGELPCYNIKDKFKYSFVFLDISDYTGLHTLGTCIFQDHCISMYLTLKRPPGVKYDPGLYFFPITFFVYLPMTPTFVTLSWQVSSRSA
jgi:hypothetical protein